MIDENIFDAAKGLHILIIGDVMIDRYLSGKVNRISPEAPVPIVSLSSRDDRMGGAGNVALNIAELGASPILCSVIGAGENGAKFKSLLAEKSLVNNGVITSTERKTTVKTRVLSNHQQLLRVDDEDVHPLSITEETNILSTIKTILQKQNIGAILFQDYNKGILTPKVIRTCIAWAKEKSIPTIVDPKFNNFWQYKGVTVFKPNLKEIRQQVQFPIQVNEEQLLKASKYINDRLDNQITLITLSENGLYLHEENNVQGIFPTKTREVIDVCGAGDTVISIVAVAIALAIPLQLMAQLANLAGGQVCAIPGVVAVDLSKLLIAFKQVSDL